jgi:hypothetical protein
VIERYGAETNPSVKWRLSKNLLTENITPLYTIGTNGINQDGFSNAKEALKTVNDNITPNLSSYVSSIVRYLKDNKITYAKIDWIYFFYDQADNNTLKGVYLPLLIYSDGKLRNLGARIILVDSKILYYIYKSKTTQNVPSEFGYPDGGILYKRILDSNFSVISETQVDTGGRYDPPITPECNSDIDPNSGIKLLIQEIIKPEIEQYSNIIAILDYARPVKPQDECNEEGNCEAKIYVNSFSRTFTIDNCREINFYNNTGEIIYNLEYTTERYSIEKDGNFTMTSKSTGYDVKTQSYNKTVTISGSSINSSLIIDPFKTNKLYDYHNDSDPTISCNSNYVNNLSCNKYMYSGSYCAQAPVIKIVCNWVSICDELCPNSNQCCKSHLECICKQQ